MKTIGFLSRQDKNYYYTFQHHKWITFYTSMKLNKNFLTIAKTNLDKVIMKEQKELLRTIPLFRKNNEHIKNIVRISKKVIAWKEGWISGAHSYYQELVLNWECNLNQENPFFWKKCIPFLTMLR